MGSITHPPSLLLWSPTPLRFCVGKGTGDGWTHLAFYALSWGGVAFPVDTSGQKKLILCTLGAVTPRVESLRTIRVLNWNQGYYEVSNCSFTF